MSVQAQEGKKFQAEVDAALSEVTRAGIPLQRRAAECAVLPEADRNSDTILICIKIYAKKVKKRRLEKATHLTKMNRNKRGGIFKK